jgi:hypothetical protein
MNARSVIDASNDQQQSNFHLDLDAQAQMDFGLFLLILELARCMLN